MSIIDKNVESSVQFSLLRGVKLDLHQTTSPSCSGVNKLSLNQYFKVTRVYKVLIFIWHLAVAGVK